MLPGCFCTDEHPVNLGGRHPEGVFKILPVAFRVDEHHVRQPARNRVEATDHVGHESVRAHDLAILDERVVKRNARVEHERRPPMPVQASREQQIDMSQVADVQNVSSRTSQELNADRKKAGEIAAREQQPSPRKEIGLVAVIFPEIKVAIDNLGA